MNFLCSYDPIQSRIALSPEVTYYNHYFLHLLMRVKTLSWLDRWILNWLLLLISAQSWPNSKKLNKTSLIKKVRYMIWNEQNKMTCLFHDLIFLLFVPGWLGAMSMSVSLFVSPIIIGFCRRKSTRLTAVMGGLVTALGCLFTSFASQFHQLFLSYGAMIGKII